MDDGAHNSEVKSAVSPAPVPAPKKRPWFQFSLCTLLLFVFLCGSGMGLWWKWEPWALADVAPTSMGGVTTPGSRNSG